MACLQGQPNNEVPFAEVTCGYAIQCKQCNTFGAGIAQWLECRTRDRKVAGSDPCRSSGRIFFLHGQLSVLTVISVSVPPPCYRSSK